MLYQVTFKRYHLEEADWQIVHDVEAPQAADALAAVLEDYRDSEEGGEPRLRVDEADEPIDIPDAVALWHERGEIHVWQLGEFLYVFTADAVRLEDSQTCPTCHERGRVPIA